MVTGRAGRGVRVIHHRFDRAIVGKWGYHEADAAWEGLARAVTPFDKVLVPTQIQ